MNTIISNNIKCALASILSVAAIAYVSSCTKLEDPDVKPEPEVENIVYPVYEIPVDVRVSSDAESKALYDENLAVAWELSDKMLALKGKTAVPSKDGTTTDIPSFLSADEYKYSEGVFTGKIESTCSPSVATNFHFIYSNSEATLSTSTSRTSSGLFTKKYTYILKTSGTITIPSEQDSKWIPYLYGATGEVVSVSDVALTPLTASLAFRVYESDGTTPKRVNSIVIEAENNIVGTISGSSSVQTEESSNTQSANDLYAGPISNWTFNGEGKTITSTDLSGVELMNGIYEYRFNIPAGVDFGALTVTMKGVDGSIIRRTVPAKAEGTAAGHKRNLKVKWDAASITLSANTWYEDYKTNRATTLEGGKIYLSSTKYGMSEDAQPVYYVDGNQVSPTDGTFEATSGQHTVQVKVNFNGNVIESDPVTVIVTKIPQVTSVDYWSSYTKNGVVTKRNDIDGNKVYAQVQLNDPYLLTLATSKVLTVDAADKTASATVSGNVLNLVSSAVTLGQRSISASISLPNDYTIQPGNSTEIVTGIPHSATPPTQSNGWTGSGEWNSTYVRLNSSDNLSLSLYVPEDTAISLYEELSINGKTLTLKYYLDCSGTRLASYERTYGRTTNHNETFNTTLKAANPVIKCTSEASGASTSYADLKKITIQYR